MNMNPLAKQLYQTAKNHFLLFSQLIKTITGTHVLYRTASGHTAASHVNKFMNRKFISLYDIVAFSKMNSEFVLPAHHHVADWALCFTSMSLVVLAQ
jgi:hypothetical protein